jgi:predicted ATPase with chaperone activity
MAARHIRKFCPLDTAGQKLLEIVTDRLGLSARSYTRILKVARTIADLARNSPNACRLPKLFSRTRGGNHRTLPVPRT